MDKRNKLYVEHQVQAALGKRIVLHWLVFLLLSFCVTTSLRVFSNIVSMDVFDSLGLALRDQITTVVVMLALLPWFVYDSLKLSNRFAGPMMRLRSVMRQLAKNDDAPDLKFRTGDFWYDFASDFNDLRGRTLSERKELAHLRQIVKSQLGDDEESTIAITVNPLSLTGAASQPVS
ncbi:MAG: hypothetical protein KDB03_25240 [Planctomycetales bacterium]|nr:hypothetical protein [Planctomycetales bacterium]